MVASSEEIEAKIAESERLNTVKHELEETGTTLRRLTDSLGSVATKAQLTCSHSQSSETLCAKQQKIAAYLLHSVGKFRPAIFGFQFISLQDELAQILCDVTLGLFAMVEELYELDPASLRLAEYAGKNRTLVEKISHRVTALYSLLWHLSCSEGFFDVALRSAEECCVPTGESSGTRSSTSSMW